MKPKAPLSKYTGSEAEYKLPDGSEAELEQLWKLPSQHMNIAELLTVARLLRAYTVCYPQLG